MINCAYVSSMPLTASTGTAASMWIMPGKTLLRFKAKGKHHRSKLLGTAHLPLGLLLVHYAQPRLCLNSP